MPVNGLTTPHPADQDGSHDSKYVKLTDPSVHVPVTVSDTASVDLTLTGQALSAAVIPGGVSHTGLANIGTNTHPQIDTALTTAAAHQAASVAHGASGAIVGATTLAADIATHAALTTGVHGAGAGEVMTTTGTQTATNKTFTSPTIQTPTISAGAWTNATHTHNTAASAGIIAHTSLSSIGTNTHAQIDTHLAALTSHGQAQGYVSGSNFIISSTTAANITGLNFAIGASEIWAYEFWAITFMSTGTGGVKFAVTGPAGATATTVYDGTTTTAATRGISKVAIGTLSSAFGAFGAVNGWIYGSGVVINSTTAGTVNFQAALTTGGDSSLLENTITHFTAKRIA